MPRGVAAPRTVSSFPLRAPIVEPPGHATGRASRFVAFRPDTTLTYFLLALGLAFPLALAGSWALDLLGRSDDHPAAGTVEPRLRARSG